MALRAFLKRILSYFGVLDDVRDLLEKTRSRPWLIYRYFQFKMVGANKKKYLKYFDKIYRDKLSKGIYIHGVNVNRYIGFRKIFEELLNKKNENFTIIETGCIRREFWSDGQSSLLFFEFLNIFGGKLISIDISKDNIDNCRKILQSKIPRTGKAKFFPIVGNSIDVLSGINEGVDLLYLDSLDLNYKNPELSMRHHLAELKSAKNIISKSKDLLLAVDDNFKELNIGKGKYVLEWARNTGQGILLENYQIVMKIEINNDHGL